jgi:two-component system cell cycle response regulator
VADDDPISRRIVETTLRSLGHDCEVASDGAQAWDAFRAGCPDVVISDWTMPGQTGLQLCTNVRGHAAGTYTYFIMLTANGTREQILEGMDAGVDDYLVKPLNSAALQARLVAAARVTALHRQLGDQRTELQELNTQLTAIARRDPLTGLSNRRALQEDIDILEARVTRYGHRYCMALLDVDHFKSYNDNYGHQAGDRVLEIVAKALNANLRSGDALYRYGGEEFLCIFPEQSLASGAKAVQRMRIGVEQLRIAHPASPHAVVTFSAGLAVLTSDEIRSATEVLKEADDALYVAKQLGRNRVEHQRAADYLGDATPSSASGSCKQLSRPVASRSPIPAADIGRA